MLDMVWKGCSMCQWTSGSLERERESEEQVTLVLVIRERRLKMTWGMLVPRKGTEFLLIAKRAAKFVDQFGQQSPAQVRQRPGDRSIGDGNRASSPRGKPDGPGETIC